jgi:peroxiredoxin
VGFSDTATMAEWVAEESFQYDVWTDTDARTLAVHYGAADSASALFPERVTMLLDRNGDLLLKYTDDIRVGTHPDQVLEDCQALFGE